MWRSLVAHLTGGQGGAGSNPVIPTIFLTKTQIAVFNSKTHALGYHRATTDVGSLTRVRPQPRMVVAPVGTVLKHARGKRNLGGYDATVDNVLRGGGAGGSDRWRLKVISSQ